MDKKRPIDIKRDSGGAADIGSDLDGAIIEMFNCGGRLIIVKERTLYEMVFADYVDPNRENIDLPNMIQKIILDQGSESELVCRTFLTANKLFKKEYLTPSINLEQALVLALDALQDLVTMNNEIKNYLETEKRVSNEYEDRRGKKISYTIPSISNVNSRCKTIFQKADHVSQALMDIIRLFYPEIKPQSYYIQFDQFIKEKYGENDIFTKFIIEALPFVLLVRNIRNCLDHRRSDARIMDFTLQVNGNIISPTIEMDYLNSKLERNSLSSILPMITDKLVTVFEQMIVHLCIKNTLEFKTIPVQVKFIPKDNRRNKYIQYSFWSPLGNKGYIYE